MDIATIDFETYYDKEYSLSKMSTEEYVRDPRFECIGVSVKINSGETDWYSGENFAGFLGSLDYSKMAILAHNTAFDGAILSWHFGIRPKLWLDTMSMARPENMLTTGVSLKALATFHGLGQKGDEVINALGKRRRDFSSAELARYGAYCTNDTDLTYALFKKIVKNFPPQELMVIDQTIRMFVEPRLELNKDLLLDHLADVRDKKEKLLDVVQRHLGVQTRDEMKKQIMSNQKFADLLTSLGVEPPQKMSPSTGLPTFAFAKTDQKFKELETHDNPVVQAVVAARLGNKSTIEETRTEAFIGIADRGKLPVQLNYAGAHTFRFSGAGGINLQNLGRKSRLRKAIMAPEGHVLIPCDSSQIEARMLAYIAGQDDLVEAFRQKRDIYSEFAGEIYGREVTKADQKERFVGKTGILSLGYGAGSARFREMLRVGNGGISVTVSEGEAAQIVYKYRKRHQYIERLWQKANDALMQMANGGSGELTMLGIKFDGEIVTLPSGLRMRYPLLQQHTTSKSSGFRYLNNPRAFMEARKRRLTGESMDDLPWVHIYGAKFIENITQALARIVITEQMTKIGVRYPVVLQVHDENVPCVREEEAEEAKAFVVGIMSTPPVWAPRLPVACEAGVGKTYGDAK